MWEAGGWVGIVWRVTYEDKGMIVTLVPITVPGRVKLFLWKGAVTSMTHVSFIFMDRGLFLIVKPVMAPVTNEVYDTSINSSWSPPHPFPPPTAGTGRQYRSLTCPMSGPRDVRSVPHLLTHSTLQSNCCSAEIHTALPGTHKSCNFCTKIFVSILWFVL